jgi:Zn-dependent protease
VKTLANYLTFWRTTTVRDREMIEAVVHPDHIGPSEELEQALDHWPGVHYWATRKDENRLVLLRALEPAPKERWWLHILLFLGTFFMVWKGGALLLGESSATIPSLAGGASQAVRELIAWLPSTGGLSFATALMAILLTHEMGHYFAAKRYGINTSPPFFIPAPVEVNFIGTFGAFIRLRSPVVDRRQLLDVGAAGPWAGVIVALLMLVVGLDKSFLVRMGEPGMVVEMGRSLRLGDSLLTLWLRNLILGEGRVILDPLAVAGWVGLLVTTFNLLPLGQLDGGHILYALLGDRQRHLGILAWTGLVVLGWWVHYWPWLLLAGLILVLGGGRLAHPPVLERERPLPPSRWPLAWASIVLFVVTFAPVPILL